MNNEPQSRVIYQESPRDFRTEIPNIVFEMLEEGLISSADFQLYCSYRRIAGEHGACWVGTRGLQKKTGLSHPTIAKSKKNLSRSFEILGGKSLIHITPCDRKMEQADTVTIMDIWHENFYFFKNKLTCEKRRHTGVKKEDTRVCKNLTHKKEPIKKEPLEEVIIAKPPAEAKVPKSEPLPAGGNNNHFSALDSCEDLSPRQKAQFNKYSEEVVIAAVKYVYHPNTQLKGPNAKIKQLHAFCKDPDAYADTLKQLEDPHRGKSLKEKIKAVFKNGETYAGYRCELDDMGIVFYSVGGQGFYEFKWKDSDFKNKFEKFVSKMKKNDS